MQTKHKRNHSLFIFGLMIFLTILLGTIVSRAQETSVFTTGLSHPAKIINAGQSSFLVAEAGTSAPNQGRISLVNRATGAKQTLIDGLPSGLSRSGNPNGDPAGPSGLKLVGLKLYVTIGSGDIAIPATGGEILNPAPSSPLFNSVLELTLSANYENSAPGFTLSSANQASLASGGQLSFVNGGGRRLDIRMIANLPDYVAEPRPSLPENIRPANLYGIELSGDSLYVPDASFNLLYRVNIAAGAYETFVAFAPKPNPTQLGPPVVEAVPDNVRLVGNQLLVPYLTGFPFVQGLSEVRSVNLDTRAQATFIPNLTSAIDILSLNGTGNDNDSYLVLEFSRNQLTQQPGQLKFFASRTETPRILIDNLITPTSFARDAQAGSIFITEDATGRIMRVSSPGDLDTTFGNGGKVVTPVTPNDDVVERVRIQSDGKIVSLGFAQDANLEQTDSFIVRHNANGTIDASFGTNGVVTVSIDKFERFFDFVILPDGKLLIVGDTYSEAEGLNTTIFRYLANGTRDSGFGTNGIVTTRIGSQFSTGSKIALQPDGKFVVFGFAFNGDNGKDGKSAVVRYNADGTLDMAFGTNGMTLIPYDNSIFRVGEILVQSDGKILVAGHGRFAGNIDFAVLRYNANGTLDGSFGVSGLVHTDVDNLANVIGGMVLQPDGKIVINGRTLTADFIGVLSSEIVRYNTNGTLDNTFGTGGIVKITEPAQNVEGIALALAIQQNGKILTAGIRNGNFAVARYNPNGTIDTSFGANGIVTTVVGTNGFDRIYSLAVQPDGKIVAAGGVNDANLFYDFVLVRHLGDAVIQKPSDFDSDGRSDLGVFRPSNGTWYTSRSMQGFYTVQFGLPTDKPAPADYDGDGKTDIAVWRDTGANSDFAYFFILNSRDNTVRVEQFGRQGDVLTVGDWDGDGKADLAVYRETAGSQSYFYYRGSLNNPSGNNTALPWGTAGDKPLPGDYDGDRRMDAAVFRPSNGIWYIRNSSDSSALYDSWGQASDTFVQADYDGDGKTDLAVFRSGIWYIKQSATNQPRYENWGLASDKPVPADYDGDGKTDVAVFRADAWYIRQSTGGIRYASFGQSGDVPIASVFVR